MDDFSEPQVMENESQPMLLPEVTLWRRPEPEPAEDKPPVRVKAVQRDQLVMRTVDVERLIDFDHPARAIWELVGQCDLRPFQRGRRRSGGPKKSWSGWRKR